MSLMIDHVEPSGSFRLRTGNAPLGGGAPEAARRLSLLRESSRIANQSIPPKVVSHTHKNFLPSSLRLKSFPPGGSFNPLAALFESPQERIKTSASGFLSTDPIPDLPILGAALKVADTPRPLSYRGARVSPDSGQTAQNNNYTPPRPGLLFDLLIVAFVAALLSLPLINWSSIL